MICGRGEKRREKRTKKKGGSLLADERNSKVARIAFELVQSQVYRLRLLLLSERKTTTTTTT